MSQSLAGRTGLLTLLPLSVDEVRRFPAPPMDLLTTLWTGGYPAIHDRGAAPTDWMAAYVGTYVERDVREVLNVHDMSTFRSFVRLCAGKTAQLLNLSALAGDAGVSHGTARAWLGVLQASFLVVRLPVWHRNLGKRLVKAPKVHIVDAGVGCWLLGIESPDQLATHPLRGALFESWVAMEEIKRRFGCGLPAGLHHYRDRRGEEVDLVLDRGDVTVALEVRAGRTATQDMLRALDRFAEVAGRSADALPVERILVCGGDEARTLMRTRVVPWSRIQEDVDWRGP